MIHLIDRLLNKYTMYRVVCYGLAAMAAFAILLGFAGILPFSGLSLVLSLMILIGVCEGLNRLLAKITRAARGMESSVITAFILFFVLSPPLSYEDVFFLVVAAVLAMASKYVLAYKRKHLFNPAAIAAVLIGVFGSGLAIWWVGSPVMLPLTGVVGFLIMRKLRREQLVFSFLIVAALTIGFVSVSHGYAISEVLPEIFLSWPLIFFATVMLTEPATTPPVKRLQVAYGVIVGILFGVSFRLGPLHASPELALVLGNVFAYAVSSRQKLLLTLKEKRELARDVMEFVFTTDVTPVFYAGQYGEWTLPHLHADDRGNRRYFTIASAPTEREVRLGVRTYPADVASSFKRTLTALPLGATLTLGSIAGDFILPTSPSKRPLVFIAGGIGVTPFRSMIQSLMDTESSTPITLFYAAPEPKNFAYGDLFLEAETSIGLKTVYLASNAQSVEGMVPPWTGRTGYLTAPLLQEFVPNYEEALFYLSGPNSMVESYQKLLMTLGVQMKNIKTDYFPGF